MDIVVKKATIEDLSEIQLLCNELGEQSFSLDTDLSTTWATNHEGEKYYRERLTGNKGVIFVAEQAGKILGFVSTTINNPNTWRLTKRVEVDNLYLKDAHHGKGVGKKLVEEVKKWSQKNHIQRIFLTAFFQNKKAIAFYEREGFIPYELTLEIDLNKSS